MKRHSIWLLPFLFALLLWGCTAGQEQPDPMTTVPESTAAQTETTEPEPERFLLTFVGDCTLGTHPGNYYAEVGFVQTVGDDYAYPFANVIEYFEEDECSFANLEGPLCEGGVPAVKKHVFRGPREFVNILTENSVEAVSLANNHTLDYGQQGYAETKQTLDDAGVSYVEKDGTVVFTTQNGLTIGMYGAVYGQLDREKIVAGIRELAEQDLDLVIFAPHWGYEGSFVPNGQQKELAHAVIEAGADIVWGSHPHVLQPVETWEDGVIFYSLGNFAFGGNGNPGDYDTVILQQEVFRDAQGNVTLGKTEMLPASVSSNDRLNDFQPRLYTPGTEEYDRVLAKLSGTWHQSCIKIG